jgi:hypothetical protein
MRCSSRPIRLVLWVLALSFLTVRASDTHLHLCFDGQEPPTTVHFADASVHDDDHHEGESHTDKDLDPFVGMFSKSEQTDSDVALAITVGTLVLLLPVDGDAQPADHEPLLVVANPSFHLRPPLRGPPA